MNLQCHSISLCHGHNRGGLCREPKLLNHAHRHYSRVGRQALCNTRDRVEYIHHLLGHDRRSTQKGQGDAFLISKLSAILSIAVISISVDVTGFYSYGPESEWIAIFILQRLEFYMSQHLREVFYLLEVDPWRRLLEPWEPIYRIC